MKSNTQSTGIIPFIFIMSCILAFLVLPITDAKAAIADGTYSVNYTVIKPESESASMANDYFVKPAKLIVKNGTMKVQITIKNSKWITKFQGTNGGNTVISSNSSQNTRLVQFNINSLSNPTEAAMTVDIDDMDYHHDYSIRFQFDESSLSLIGASGEGTTSNATNTTNSNVNSTTSTTDSTATDLNESTTQITTEDNPQTNDSSAMGLYFVMSVVSAFLLVGKLRNKIAQ